MVASREIPIEELLQHDIVTKLNKIMQDVVSKNVEWASDHLLIIMNEILHLVAELKKTDPNSKVPQQVFNRLLVNFKYFSKLLTASDIVSMTLFKLFSQLLRELHLTCLHSSTSVCCKGLKRTTRNCVSRRPKSLSSSCQLLNLISQTSQRTCLRVSTGPSHLVKVSFFLFISDSDPLKLSGEQY